MKSEKPKISIIIPVYNVEKYLRRCLDSVLNQTFLEWMAICVDDGATDKSGEILDEYAKKDKRFIVVHKENEGVSCARNVALKQVKTPYVMFLDGDDCIHPQALDIVYTLAKKKNVDIVSFKYLQSGSGVVIPDWFNKHHDTEKIKIKITDNLMRWATNRDKGENSWYIQQCFSCMHLYDFRIIKDLEFPKDVAVLEDYVFWSRVLFKNPRACIIKLPLYSYTANPNSILHTADYIRSVKNLIAAVDLSYMYMVQAKLSWFDRRRWKSRFLWDILSRVYVYAKKIDDKSILKDVRESLMRLKQNGVFDNLPDLHALRYKRRIEKFISQIS